MNMLKAYWSLYGSHGDLLLDEEYAYELERFAGGIRQSAPELADVCDMLVKQLEEDISFPSSPFTSLRVDSLTSLPSVLGDMAIEALTLQIPTGALRNAKSKRALEQKVQTLIDTLKKETKSGYPFWNRAIILVLNRWLNAQSRKASQVTIVTPDLTRLKSRDTRMSGAGGSNGYIRQYYFWIEIAGTQGDIEEPIYAVDFEINLKEDDVAGGVPTPADFEFTPDESVDIGFEVVGFEVVEPTLRRPLVKQRNPTYKPKDAKETLVPKFGGRPYRLIPGGSWPFRVVLKRRKCPRGTPPLFSKYFPENPYAEWVDTENRKSKKLAIRLLYRDAVGRHRTEPVYLKLARQPLGAT